MTDVTITVRGESHARVRPERAVAHVTATADGPERTAVIERVSALAEPLRGELAARAATGALAEWSSQRLSVWADRPWNNEGRQLDLVHHAAVEFTATFVDPTDLSDWLNDIALTDGLQVGAIEWQLTPATRARLEREVATDAVAVAVDRATAYAAAIGRHEVTPVEIADLGLLGSTTAPAAPRMMAKAAAFDSAGAAVELRPEEIVVSAGVEARFTAR
ncbi:SIMPL domain-containing protein [Microbacterium hominis]|uniref:SIMPL domain-containing protein n=1 Tax=Microbacterium hominis TaxID=162426 RepID=UPI0019657357|nr:SIMPL domain-containing protein [Microbacterium hominis]QRY40869.1 SIMPL domain-containing protein [Microbacterium hominis]